MQLPCFSCIYNEGNCCWLGFTSCVNCHHHINYREGINLYSYYAEGEEFPNEIESVGLKSASSYYETWNSALNLKYFRLLSVESKAKLRKEQPKIWEKYFDMDEAGINREVRKNIFAKYHAYWED